MLAVITLRQIVEIVLLLIVVNGVLLLPVVIAVVGAWGERAEHEQIKPRV